MRKYPKIDGEKLDILSRKRFDLLYREIKNELTFDVKENDIKILQKEIDMLAWNIATAVMSMSGHSYF